MSEYFYQLTPEIVLKAIENGGFNPTGHIFALNSYENRVYDIKLEGGEHIVAKFYRPNRWNEAQIREEHKFLSKLQDADVSVCAPMPFPDGDTLHYVDGIYYAVWPRTGGRTAHELSDTDLEIIGRLIARCHNVADTLPSPTRPALSGDEYGLKALSYIEESNTVPDYLFPRYKSAVEKSVQLYGQAVDNVPLHPVHADFHPGNLLNGSSGWFMLDFDDFCLGPAVQDIWMLIQEKGESGRRKREILVSAYETFRPFDRSWFRLIEPLRALRFIRYAGWIARRWKDPVFPQAFPHFGTVEYWEQETLDLEHQLEIIEKGEVETGLISESQEDEEELSNKDFFWDLEE